MTDARRYPAPDFGRPRSSSFQSPQQHHPPASSTFHPSMWSWTESPCEPSPAGPGQQYDYGFNPGWGNYRQQHPCTPNFGHEWHRGGQHNYWPPKNQGKRPKYKKEPDYPFFCDTCDRGFKNYQKYKEHTNQHVKCSAPDCTFMAHEKVVAIHWKNNHAPGAKRIKLETPEEIAKWREERRRNYPTLENIEKKKKLMEMREETGAVLDTAQFGRMRGRGRARGRGCRGRGFRGGHQTAPSSSFVQEKPKSPIQMSQPEDPLGALANDDHDSEKEEKESKSVVVPPKQMSSALSTLISSYGTNSESESEEEAEVLPIQRVSEVVDKNAVILNGAQENSQKNAPLQSLETSTGSAETPGQFQEKIDFNRRGGRGGRGGRGAANGRRGRHNDKPLIHRPTLLEMLLAPDIRHERNVMLQCVRYVVRSNFFGLESKAGNEARNKVETSEVVSADEQNHQALEENNGAEFDIAKPQQQLLDSLEENKDGYKDHDVETWEFNGLGL